MLKHCRDLHGGGDGIPLRSLRLLALSMGMGAFKDLKPRSRRLLRAFPAPGLTKTSF